MDDAQQQLLRAGQARFDADLGGTGQHFEDLQWDISSLAHHFTNARRIILHFYCHNDLERPLPTIYGNMVKCWLLLTRKTAATTLQTRLLAARVLWEAIEGRHPNAATTFVWSALSQGDLEAAETQMRHHWDASTTYKGVSRLRQMVSFLASQGICPPLTYRAYTPRPQDVNRHTLAGQNAARHKLPTPRALEGLADLYHQGLPDPRDQFCISAIALLVVTGMRVSELLTLPLDCEVEVCQEGVARYGLRYHSEKSGYGPECVDVRWLSLLQAQLARHAVNNLRTMTVAARARAQILEAHPDRVDIPDYDATDWISVRHLKQLLGMKDDYNRVPVLFRDLPQQMENGQLLLPVEDVEKHLLRWRMERLWTLRTGPQSVQTLSETLLLLPRNFFGGLHGSCSLLVESVVFQPIARFLAGGGTQLSIFTRMGIHEADGTPCRMNTHQFRHWLNDLADKGGMPVDVLTRWMGRQDPRDTQDYRHATIDERLIWLKSDIRNGQVTGFMADVYHELPESDRDVFLDGQIQAVHVTPLGFCVHDFAVEPCPYHLNCLRGCQHYLRTKGDDRERDNLIRVQDITVQALEAARQQEQNGSYELATAWVKHHQDTLYGIEAALAVDDDETIPMGTRIHPDERRSDGTKK